MKKVFFILIPAVILSLLSCSPKKPAEEKKSAIDTIPTMVMQIQKCTRLYTAEAHVHKIITHDDQFKIKGSFLKHEFNIPVPGSNRKVAIPMDATIKAYVDFQGFSDRNVSRKGDKIEIILPDPKMVLTGTRIDHKKLKTVCFTHPQQLLRCRTHPTGTAGQREHHPRYSQPRPDGAGSRQCSQHPHPDAQADGFPGREHSDQLPQEVHPR